MASPSIVITCAPAKDPSGPITWAQGMARVVWFITARCSAASDRLWGCDAGDRGFQPAVADVAEADIAGLLGVDQFPVNVEQAALLDILLDQRLFCSQHVDRRVGIGHGLLERTVDGTQQALDGIRLRL